jgi:hypothetical protein
MRVFEHFAKAFALDSEYKADPGERQIPHCLAGVDLHTGQTFILRPGDPCGEPLLRAICLSDTLLVGFSIDGEIASLAALGHKPRGRFLDTRVETLRATNSLFYPASKLKLFQSLDHYGIPHRPQVVKDAVQVLGGRGAPFTSGEYRFLSNGCRDDALDTRALVEKLEASIDVEAALLSGWYIAETAAIQEAGIPLNVDLLGQLRQNRKSILVAAAPLWNSLGFFHFDPKGEIHFDRKDKFERYLHERKIPWPQTKKSGQVAISQEAFERMLLQYPELAPTWQLLNFRNLLTNLDELPVGSDGSNRYWINPFGSATARNQPSNAQFILGFPSYLRALIRPEPGTALIYLDFAKAEIGIAAALSHDPHMIAAYRSGDVYTAFGVAAKLLPPTATKWSHPIQRGLLKIALLAIQYGIGVEKLALTLSQSRDFARNLINAHHRDYAVFWRWLDDTARTARSQGFIRVGGGWRLRVDQKVNELSLRNFPVQATGAEILRLATCFLGDGKIRVVALLHDALMLEVPLAEVNQQLAKAKQLIVYAGQQLLDGFELGVDAKIITDHFELEGEEDLKMWALLKEFGAIDLNAGRQRPSPHTGALAAE